MNSHTDHFTPRVLQRVRSESFLQQIEFHPELPSTNDRALELCRDAEARTPFLVLTERQSAGRGRGENRWWSAAGGLTFSLVVDTNHSRKGAQPKPQVSLTTALAVCATLEDLLPGPHVRLKWPNDVYLRGRKVSGILVEVPPDRPDRLAIGIGLNVNNSFDDAPAELRTTATSLLDETGLEHHLGDVLVALLTHLAAQLRALDEERPNLLDEWRPRCLLSGRSVHVTAGPRTIAGLCRGIDDDGALLLATASGVERCYGGVVTRFE